MKNSFKNVALILAGAFTGFLIAEAAIRIALPSYSSVIKLHRAIESERGKFARYDANLGWAGLENAEDTFEWADTRHHVRHNRYGYRGREYDFQRSDKKRILVLGDSFVWGFGVEDNDILTAILEQRTDHSIEFVNMGVSGYGNDQEYLLWKHKGHKWAPDKLLLMITIYTDFWDNAHAERYGYPKPVFTLNEEGELRLSNVPVPEKEGEWSDPAIKIKGRSSTWFDKLSSYSAAANFIQTIALHNRHIRKYLEEKDAVLTRLPGYGWEYPLYLKKTRAEDTGKWKLMFKIIEKLHDDAAAKGTKLSVAIIPSIVQVYPELWAEFTNNLPLTSTTMNPEAPNRHIAEWCKNNGIDVIDLLPGLKKAGETNPYLYFPINRHWTRDGHSVVADIIASRLLDR